MDGARCLGLRQTRRDSVFLCLSCNSFHRASENIGENRGRAKNLRYRIGHPPRDDDGNDAWLAAPRWINIVIVIVESSIIIIIIAINAKGAEKPTLAPSGKCDLLCDHLPKNVCNVLEKEGPNKTNVGTL